METFFKQFAGTIAAGVEIAAALTIAYGAVEAIYGVLGTAFSEKANVGRRKAVWIRFAVWLLLGLEFELASDIIRTTIAPSWTQIGQLASIGLIRTFLNFFLEKDLDKYGQKMEEVADDSVQEETLRSN
jgi:uncharacterized membrane protein